MARRLPDAALLTLVTLLPFLFFLPVVLGRAHFLYGDFISQFWSFAAYKTRALWEGRLPLWSPHLFSGYPFFAEPQAALFYPPTWLTALLNGPGLLSVRVYELEVLAHLSLAGSGTYLFLRRLVGHPGAALAGSLTFAFSGYATSYPLLQSSIIETAAWLPWVLYACHRALTGSGRWFVGAAILWSLSFLAGHQQIAHYVAWLALAFTLAYGWRLRAPWRPRLAHLAVAGLAAAGLTAGQWLPTLELVSLSIRSTLGYQTIAQGFGWSEFGQLLRPPPPPFWAPLYVGLLPLGLAVIGLARRDFQGAFWGSAALTAALLSVADRTPLFRVVYLAVPSFRLFTRQERVAVLIAFALAVLAALGLAYVLRRSKRGGWVALAAAALILGELHAANATRSTGPGPAWPLAAPPPVLAEIQPQPGERFYNEGVLQPNVGVAHGVESLGGESPLRLRHYEPYLQGEVPRPLVWRLLNVRYVATWAGGLDVPFETLAEGSTREGGPLYLHRLEPGLGPAWWVGQARYAEDPVAALQSEGFDPRREVVLERRVETPRCDREARLTGRPHRWRLEAPCPGWLVLSEIWYPGWQAWLDGRPVTLNRANGALMAVEIPAGGHELELRFRPRSLQVGGLVTLATLGLLALVGGGLPPPRPPPQRGGPDSVPPHPPARPGGPTPGLYARRPG